MNEGGGDNSDHTCEVIQLFPYPAYVSDEVLKTPGRLSEVVANHAPSFSIKLSPSGERFCITLKGLRSGAGLPWTYGGRNSVRHMQACILNNLALQFREYGRTGLNSVLFKDGFVSEDRILNIDLQFMQEDGEWLLIEHPSFGRSTHHRDQSMAYTQNMSRILDDLAEKIRQSRPGFDILSKIAFRFHGDPRVLAASSRDKVKKVIRLFPRLHT
ncbi:hypothetical protein COV82_00155 [Candidatus Peregrinibacteria bacterium CG11_big_fil_rev_8_21_14_0_20_46_8]|nr:MAG: hypothetical protein COV82_00155 [Candidatus Peregrinibacteria bacterium CG11_big_fil_rev_8_21_14_0_20_46_8]